jgi:nucleoside-diphosphate-sugar epimerase
MKILVTGAAGFIGSHTSEKLASLGHQVTGADNLSDFYSPELKLLNIESQKNKGINFIKLDLRYADQYDLLPKDFDYIFHFAAQPGLSAKSSFEDYLDNNINATYKLIQFAKQCTQLRLFVNISTSSVYGADATKDETAVPAPVSFYGITKLAAEQLVLAESRNNIFKACSLRLYSVYGPRERPDKLYTKLIRSALCDEPFTLIEGSLQHKRSFTFIGDIIKGVIEVLNKEKILNNEIINIGSDVQHTTADAIELVQSLTDKQIIFDMQQRRLGEQLSTKAITHKAQRLLNYNATTSLREGIQQQIEWFKTSGVMFLSE